MTVIMCFFWIGTQWRDGVTSWRKFHACQGAVNDVTRLRLLAYLRGSCVPVWYQCDKDSLVAALRWVAVCVAWRNSAWRTCWWVNWDDASVLLARSRKCEKRPLASSVRLSVCTEQLGSHWTDFHEIWYLSIFRKSVEKIQTSLKSEKNNGSFTWRPIYIFDSISFSS